MITHSDPGANAILELIQSSLEQSLIKVANLNAEVARLNTENAVLKEALAAAAKFQTGNVVSISEGMFGATKEEAAA